MYDGEGSIPEREGRDYHFEFNNSDRDITECGAAIVAELLHWHPKVNREGGDYKKCSDNGEKGKDMWRFYVTDKRLCFILARLVLPYMGRRRTLRIRSFLGIPDLEVVPLRDRMNAKHEFIRLLWAAGYMDAEGHFQDGYVDKNGRLYEPSLSVSATDPDLIVCAHDLLGSKQGYGFSPSRSKKRKNRRTISMSGFTTTLPVLRDLLHFLGKRRSAAISRIIDEQTVKRSRSTKKEDDHA
jgi:hypothetical protein